jgi:hypothetical protein
VATRSTPRGVRSVTIRNVFRAEEEMVKTPAAFAASAEDGDVGAQRRLHREETRDRRDVLVDEALALSAHPRAYLGTYADVQAAVEELGAAVVDAEENRYQTFAAETSLSFRRRRSPPWASAVVLIRSARRDAGRRSGTHVRALSPRVSRPSHRGCRAPPHFTAPP